jgi:CO/xanthine dehydrogenase Mo-binding subunit
MSIGQNLRRRDAADKLSGRTRFTIDRRVPGMLHAALRRSDVAAATLLRVDVAPALAMPGVRAVTTAADAPGRYGVGIADHPLFAADLIRYHGEPIAAVAADTIEQAEAAAAAIVVEAEPLAAVVTMAAALAPGARHVHPDWERYEELEPDGVRAGNVAWEATVVRGDLDSAMARDDVVVVESTYAVGRQNQASLEPRVAIASVEDGRVVVETSTQNPWAVRSGVARLLGISESLVRVVAPAVGGGFGQKFEPSVEPIAALLAWMTRSPVRIALSREEEMRTALARENADIFIRSAVTADGEIVAREAVVLMDCGAYAGEQTFLTAMTAHTLMGNYRLGAVRSVSRAVYTNTAPTGAFRCCNGVYCTFALERHTDEICAAIGMDRWEFRRRNLIGDGDLGATGQRFEGDVLVPMLDRMSRLRPGPSQRPDDGRLYGTSIAVGTWFVFVGPSAATVNLNPDGSATLITAGVEVGSGSLAQALPQIVADQLGIDPADVIVKAADTDAAGFDSGVGGGRTTVSLGAASAAACAEVRRKLFDAAADRLEAAPHDLELVDGMVGVRGSPSTRVPISEVVEHAHSTTGPISGSGAFTGPGAEALPGCAAGHMVDALDLPVFAVHECDVAVDPATGHVEILAYRVVQDVGRAINPRAVEGQIQGGVVQGLGYALHEEITIDDDGRIRQAGFETYRLPLAGDVVAVDTELYEGAPSFGPMGAKGAGEVPILAVGAAVACAVADAVQRPVSRLPLTPPRVLSLLLGREDSVGHDHIPRSWRANVLTDPAALEAAAPV